MIERQRTIIGIFIGHLHDVNAKLQRAAEQLHMRRDTGFGKPRRAGGENILAFGSQRQSLIRNDILARLARQKRG